MVYTVIKTVDGRFGRALAEEFARRKRNLILVGPDNLSNQRLIDSLHHDFNIKIKHFESDPENINWIEQFANWLKIENLNIDTVLICPPSNHSAARFDSQSITHIRQTMGQSMYQTVYLIKELIPFLESQTCSNILIAGYLDSFTPVPKRAIDSAAGGFNRSFTHALGYELNNSNITVSYLGIPQFFGNNFKHNGLFNTDVKKFTEEAVESMIKGKKIILTGPFYKLWVWLGRHLPTRLRLLVSEKFCSN